jgi:hypothetical protein
MNKLSLISLAAALAATSACSVMEPIESKTYNLADFDSVSASHGVNVRLKQGPFSVSAEGPKSKLNRLIIERRGSELAIRREPTMSWFSSWSQTDIVTVVAPAYSSIAASGGADVDGDDLQLGDIRIDTSGGADLNLSGVCKTLTMETSGGADFNAKDLTCETATVSASGGADVSVTVTGNASGHGSGGADIDFYGVTGTAIGEASSGADIRFHGSPAIVQRDESSGGDVEVSGD